MKALSPMMAQYVRIKEQLPEGTLLFIRLGDFYEAFFDDAKIAARVLNLTLAHRGEVAMCGVPYHAIQKYSAKLVLAGHKVAIKDE